MRFRPLRSPALRHTLLALWAACIGAPATAQEEDTAASDTARRRELATPVSTLQLGLDLLGGDRRAFGLYNGMSDAATHARIDLDLVKRDDPSGTWFKLRGRNLGLDTRELRIEQERQGDWAYFLEAGQMTRRDPLQVTTGLQGIGSAAQTVSSTAPRRGIELTIDHDSYAAGVRKYLLGNLDISASYRQDDKKGDRLFGQGNNATTTINFLTETLARITRQWELVANYAERSLQLAGGYSGSSFENKVPAINVTGGVAGLSPIATPPSNQAHQFHLSGGYNFASSSRTSFRLSRSVATQDSVFTAPPAVGAQTSPDLKVVTTLAYADLNLPASERIDINAQLRFEDRSDRSKTAQYVTAAATSATSGGLTGFNQPRSLKQLKGSLEAGVRLDDGYRLIGTLEQEQLDRNTLTPYRLTAFRQKTDETQMRVELKRTLSETLNGGIALIHARRTGSDYMPDTYTAAADSNQLSPLIWADRKRSKVRLTADWVPDEQWSVQFLGDASGDRYSGRSLGPRKGDALHYSVDAAYRLSERWQTHTWLSQERSTTEQSTRTNLTAAAPNNGVIWDARLRNQTSAWGIGTKGNPYGKLEIGADLALSFDAARFGLARTGGGTGSPSALPDIGYRHLNLKLFADQPLDRDSGIRTELIIDRRHNNDWTWQNWTYTDGTTVSLPARQRVTALGASYYFKWR
jgi:MtrB/PioB family decaheme-associated outer membrane protein